MKPVTKRLPQAEFIALMAMLAATIAFSIDAMLPALPDIAQELTPDNLTLAQLVLTSFILGMGAGTLITGPLSDAFGRKPVIVVSAGLYIIGAILAWAARCRISSLPKTSADCSARRRPTSRWENGIGRFSKPCTRPGCASARPSA